jgi:GH25 family lysozyme M1 (1,4-beta-N-acetylmuramidase)
MVRRVVLDVSSHNGDVDFAAIKRSHPEVVGVFIKATEGTTYANPAFGAQYDRARAAGLLTGAYSFAHPQNLGTRDVQFFLSVLGSRVLELGTAWDCEISDGLVAGTVLARFLEDMTALGRDPRRDLIYTGKWFWDPNTVGSIGAHVEKFPLWVSWYQPSFDPARALPVPWTSCRFWQFTDNYFGLGLDASVWMGTDDEWNLWVGSTPGANRYQGFPVIRKGSSDHGPGNSLGDKTKPVTSWQNAWNILYRHESRTDPARLAPDGEFGVATDLATRRLQEDYHRIKDGIVGDDSWTLAAVLLTGMKR